MAFFGYVLICQVATLQSRLPTLRWWKEEEEEGGLIRIHDHVDFDTVGIFVGFFQASRSTRGRKVVLVVS